MKRVIGSISLVLVLVLLATACQGEEEEGPASPVVPTPGGKAIGLIWYGHSMFLLTSPGGTDILIDPNSGIGYQTPELPKIDAVAISHDHFDHNKVEVAGPDAMVLAGIQDDQWADIDEKVGDVRIRTIPTYHDDKEGADRGKNSMFLFETADMRILFAGDLGHVLSEEQVAAAGEVDILILPVGGYFTIGAAEATQVMEQLQPKLVIPMHYKTDVVSFEGSDNLQDVQPFLEGKTVGQLTGTLLTMEKARLPATTAVLLMNFR